MARKNTKARKRDAPMPIDELVAPPSVTDELDLGSWFILRMSSSETLPVVRALTANGYRVWTPIERKFSRMPRTRVRYAREMALMPSYAFAWVEQLDDILKLALLPTKECGRFSVFHHKGGIPLIADSQLAALRGEERRLWGIFDRARRKGVKVPTLKNGDIVTMSSGPFQGLSGVVEGTNGQNTLVSFAGFHAPIKIASLLLLPEVVSAGLPDAA